MAATAEAAKILNIPDSTRAVLETAVGERAWAQYCGAGASVGEHGSGWRMWLRHIFAGQLCSRLICGRCNEVSPSFDIFWDFLPTKCN